MVGLLSLQDERPLIAQCLSVQDRLNLAATCKSLHQASLHWFPEVAAIVLTSRKGIAHAQSLAAWLRRHPHSTVQVEIREPVPLGAPNRSHSRPSSRPTPALFRELLLPLAGLPGLASLSTSRGAILSVPAECLAPLTTLTSIELPVSDIEGSLEHLGQLAATLRVLRFVASTQLPASLALLSRLTALQSLKVDHVRFGTVAKALPHMPALTSLALSGWGEFLGPPPSWRHLSTLCHLQHLDLRSVPNAAQVPQHLAAAAPPLLTLQLPMCRLEAVPAAMSRLTSLEGLHLGDNTSLQAGLQHLAPLHALRSLRLDGCHRLGPEGLQPLEALGSCLQLLSIEGCQLAALPSVLSCLTALTGLYCGYNGGEAGALEGWQHLRCLTHLLELDARECMLEELPPELSSCTALTSLGLGANVGLGAGQQLCALSHLTQLQELDVFGCKLSAVPPSFSCLSSLTALHMRHNRGLALAAGDAGSTGTGGGGQGVGWCHLAALPALLLVNCHSCKLGVVPAELSALTHLTVLV